MSWIERATIVGNMKYVIDVLPMNDSDDTACDGIKSAHSKYKKQYDWIYFGNGGDRNPTTVPGKEQELCENWVSDCFGNLAAKRRSNPQTGFWTNRFKVFSHS